MLSAGGGGTALNFSTKFIETFQIVRKLGAGGMGDVLLARELALDRLVAIKTVAADRFGGADARGRFLQEARITGNLSHPNILRLLNQGEDEGCVWIAFAYVEGGDLAGLLKKQTQLPPADFFRIAVPVADAIDYAHSQRVLHRDIKSANVLLDGEGSPRVADFGLAKSDTLGGGVKTETGIIMGTPHYMAPELGLGERATPATDQYALGILLYEMLAGQLPFQNDNPLVVLRMHADLAPKPIAGFRPDVPAALEALVMRALVKRPGERWESVAQLRDELRAIDGRVGTRWGPRRVTGRAAAVVGKEGLEMTTRPGVAARDLASGNDVDSLPARPQPASRPSRKSAMTQATPGSPALGGLRPTDRTVHAPAPVGYSISRRWLTATVALVAIVAGVVVWLPRPERARPASAVVSILSSPAIVQRVMPAVVKAITVGADRVHVWLRHKSSEPLDLILRPQGQKGPSGLPVRSTIRTGQSDGVIAGLSSNTTYEIASGSVREVTSLRTLPVADRLDGLVLARPRSGVGIKDLKAGAVGDHVAVGWKEDSDSGRGAICFSESLDGGDTWTERMELANQRVRTLQMALAIDRTAVHVAWHEEGTGAVLRSRSTTGGGRGQM